MENKCVVMAVRTAEIAVGKKDHGTDLSRPIDERSFQESFDFDHRSSASKGRTSWLRKVVEEMLLDLLEGWHNTSPADHLLFFFVLYNNRRRGENTVEGSLGQPVEGVQVIMKNRNALLLQRCFNLFGCGTLRTFRFDKNL